MGVLSHHRDLSTFLKQVQSPHLILHHRLAGAIAVLVAQPFEDPLGLMPLLAGAVRSAPNIASITGISGPSLGFSAGRVRT